MTCSLGWRELVVEEWWADGLLSSACGRLFGIPREEYEEDEEDEPRPFGFNVA
jgi:hypothetical protein